MGNVLAILSAAAGVVALRRNYRVAGWGLLSLAAYLALTRGAVASTAVPATQLPADFYGGGQISTTGGAGASF